METNNYILNTINEIKEILEKSDYRKNRYNKDLEWFKAKERGVNGDIIRVAIMGITSSGKSTLVNTLLGEKILPMAIRPSSSIIITASKGIDRQATIYFRDEKPQILKGSSLNEKIVGEYADESRNPNNKLKVTQIDITTPYFLLDENIHIIDSPGLDAWNLDNHEKLTLEILLPTIDICIFLTTVKASSDEINAEKISIVNEKQKEIILVQNMIDSIEEKIGKNGIIEEDKFILLKKHRKRAENLLREGTNNKEGFEVIQISALNALNGIINNNKELYKKSNIEGLVRSIEICVKKIIPKINKQREESIRERINNIIITDKEIISGSDLKTIELLMKVKIKDIDNLVNEFRSSIEKILLKIKAIEGVISDTINEISSSSSEEFESYLNIVDKINNKNLYIESDILSIVKECEDKKNEVYRKLNIDLRFAYFLPNSESKNIHVKHKYEEKTRLLKKDGALNIGKRLLSNIFDKEWGYKEVEYDEKVVDKDATIDMAKNICNENKIKYINILKDWSIEYIKSTNIFYDETSKRAEEYKEKKKQNIEIYDIEDVNKSLKIIKEKITKSKHKAQEEAGVTSNECEKEIYQCISKDISYPMPKEQYNIYKLSNEIIEKNYLLVGNYLKEKSREKMTEEINEIFWTWDINSCMEFISRIFGIYLDEHDGEIIKKEGIHSFNNITIIYESCEKKLDFYTTLKKIKEKQYHMFIVFDGIQIGSSKKQILESVSLNYFTKNNNLTINLVIDSYKIFINAKNIKELLGDVSRLKEDISSKFNNDKEGYILINSKNPLYNMALIEGQENTEFIISDYRDIKERLFKNTLSRGLEEKETLEEILSYFLNKEHNTK